METHEIADALRKGNALWESLYGKWEDLKIPVSRFARNDVIMTLLLAEFGGKTTEQAAKLLQTGHELFESMKRSGQSMVLTSIDGPLFALLALLSERRDEAKAAASAQVAPQLTPEPPPFQEVPPPEPLEEAQVAKETPATSLTLESCPHCGHNFEQCKAGEYRAVENQFCRHIDAKGKCAECSDENIEECADCEESIPESRAVKCRNFDDCGNIFCDNCKKNLDDYGFCDSDCAFADCSRCETETRRGLAKFCSNQNTCRMSDELYCDDCAALMLKENGLCFECAGEGYENCNECELNFGAPLAVTCKECECVYCPSCAKDFSASGICCK